MIYFYLIPGAIILYILIIMFGTTEKFHKFREFNLEHSNKFGILGVITEFAAIAFILTPLWLYNTLSTRNKFERVIFLQWQDLAKYTITISIIMSLLIWSVHRILDIEYTSEFLYGMFFGLTLIIWMSVFLYAMFILSLYINKNINHRVRLSQPVGVLTCALIDALYVIETECDKWNLFDFKHRVMRHIEISAQCCDTYFVRRFVSEDPVTNAWLKMQMDRAAAGIRAKKRFLLMPESEGRHRLVNSLHQTLVACALGKWNSLEQQGAEASVTPVNLPWYHGVGTIARGLIIGLLPAAGLAAWQLPALQLPEIPASAAAFLTNTVVVWAVVSFLGLLDPQSLEKAKAVTEITKKIP